MPTHTPAGNCRNCGYPIDPGRCPECGVICMDVRPIVRTSRGRLALAAALGFSSIPVAFVLYHGAESAQRILTSGIVAGDVRIADAWLKCTQAALLCHFVLLPMLLIGLTVLLARAEKRRQQAWRGAVVVAAFALGIGLVSWLISGFVLIATYSEGV